MDTLKRYQCFSEYGDSVGRVCLTEEFAIQSAIEKLNGDRAAAIKVGMPEPLISKEVKTFEDLDKGGIGVASFTLHWERGWQARKEAKEAADKATAPAPG